MDVAFVSEFVGKERWFRHVDAKGPAPLKAGDSMSLSDGYCQRVIDGLLPELIVDTAAVPAAMTLPDTRAVPIGSHLSVPIRLRSGRVYGTFCCFNFNTDPTLNPRDLQFMRAFADLAAFQIDAQIEAAESRTGKSTRIGAALARGEPAIVYQPVIGLDTMRVVGVEGLARFGIEPTRGPQAWFLSHILNLSPEHIKLDVSLTRHIDVDRERRALAAALIEFGRQTGGSIVAEGVESIEELDALRELGVQRGQGRFLSEPVPGEALAALIADFATRGASKAPDEPH